MSAATLPSKILLKIFSNVNKKTLILCTYVCKSWSQPASQSLFKELRLITDRVHIVKRLLEENADQHMYFKHGVYVKKFTMINTIWTEIQIHRLEGSGVISKNEFTEEQFIKLLEYMPNLQILDLKSIKCEKYLFYILKSKSTKCLNHIQIFELPFIELYFLVCYKYRASIVNFRMERWMDYQTLGYHTNKTLTLLSQFTSLKTLILCIHPDKVLAITDLLEASPNLKSLEIRKTLDFPAVYHRHNYSSQGDFIWNHATLSDLIRTNVIKKNVIKCHVNTYTVTMDNPNTTLKKLTLVMATVSEADIKNINDCIFNQLQSLRLELDITLNEFVNHVGVENAMSLVKRMSTMQCAMILFKRYSLERPLLDESSMTNHFKLFNTFRGSIKTCSARYGYTSAIRDPSLFEYALQRSDYYHQMNDGSQTIQITSPDISYSIIGPEIFDSLEVEIRESDPKLTIMFLKYATINCPNLQSYTFNNLCETDQQIRVHLRKHKNPEKYRSFPDPKNVKERLRVLAIAYQIPTNWMTDKINFYLPFTQLYCLSEIKKDTSNNVRDPINISSMHYLERFYMNLARSCTWIRIKYVDGNESYYHYSSRNHSFKRHSLGVFNREGRPEVRYSYVRHKSCTIICRKKTTLVFFWGEKFVVAEIEDGELHDYITINSDYKNMNFAPQLTYRF